MISVIRKISATFIWWFLASASFCYAQDKATVISSPEHQKILKEFQSKADAYCAKNLNRFGLDEMQKYDRTLDSLFANEKEDTIAAIQKIYSDKSVKRKEEYSNLKTQSEELNQAKEIYANKYHSLLRKAAIAFIVWLGVVLLLISWRKRLVMKSQTDLDATLTQLQTSEQFFADGEKLFQSASEWQKKNTEINLLVSEIQKSISTLSEKLSPELFKSESFGTLQKNTEAIQSSVNRFANISNNIIAQHEEPTQEKKLTNINQLCEQYADLAYTTMLYADGTFACQLSKDFEKNLPSIKIIPETVGSLLLNIFANAFHSINEKLKNEIKGYIPKVSISTRVLPRFVQIRIKDNGNGITDEGLSQLYAPFYSTQPVGEGAGLGLYFSEQIIKENNGELKIESEAGNGTDVYIKFFLHK